MTGAGPIGLFVKTRPELDVAGRAISVPRRQRANGRRPDAQVPGLHAGGDPVPAGKPRLAAHHQRPIRRRPPAMQPNYLSTQSDKDTIVAGLKVIAPHLRHRAMRHYVTEEYLPGPAGHDRRGPAGTMCAPPRGTTFHQTSTCMMGPGPMAVVDTELRVKGLRGSARDRCLDHADGGVGQHQRHGHHDRREGGRRDPSGGVTQAGVVRDPMQRFGCDGSGQRYRPVASSQGRRAKDAAPTTSRQ